ncbi:SGNH/GDSL hydrolase family protein [Streptomyces somaliensis]|uniref:SGNH/GDSL hydrolase family protein n=1 Tax=Streptomyces somaliensis TaxID=78355 RepID=UPI0020CE4E91|nr:SGNH/GDSL hydrolase family protein [Streptomyces somaliensis]MCP9943560.1 SGNH/GDSL hydrolase family protein [Streptomyces somaliensis]MCP9963191.1 SGNH/GDSL hydrolase family protein [Streptomyces somaliensis]MCP9976028.1 SGNH/GDSL hydrolase family protein [Streptomyces somaliensis]
MPLNVPAGSHILFQGDSITDGGRDRRPHADVNAALGHGYVYLVAARVATRAPGHRWRVTNRGVGGDKVTELAVRWQSDALDPAPDVLSVLVGVNDAWRVVDGESCDIDADGFRAVYDILLTRTRRALPTTRVLLCEPFCLPGGPDTDFDEALAAQVQLRQHAVAELAAAHHVELVRLQPVFDEALRRAPAAHWIHDGVHPTPAGHQLLADAWVSAVAAGPPGR